MSHEASKRWRQHCEASCHATCWNSIRNLQDTSTVLATCTAQFCCVAHAQFLMQLVWELRHRKSCIVRRGLSFRDCDYSICKSCHIFVLITKSYCTDSETDRSGEVDGTRARSPTSAVGSGRNLFIRRGKLKRSFPPWLVRRLLQARKLR